MNDDNLYRRVYVDVIVKNNKDGTKRPLYLIWEDGQRFEIDRVKQICRAAARKAGGTGIRYTIVINGKETYIFEDDNRWFVEAKIYQ